MTRIPVPEARRSSPSVSRRKRHVAGSESVKKNEMTDILDPNVKSKPVLPSGGAGSHRVSESDAEMDSSLGILSPSDMKTSGLMSMTASQASNQGTKERSTFLCSDFNHIIP